MAEVVAANSLDIASNFPHFRILNGPQEGTCVPLDFARLSEKPFIIGRTQEASLLLVDPLNRVSRKHAELSWRKADEILILRNLSANGTYLNDQLLSCAITSEVIGSNTVPLYPGDIIGLGSIKLLFSMPLVGIKTLLAQLPNEKHQPEDSWPGVARLEVITASGGLRPGSICRLNPQHTLSLGRLSNNDLQIVDPDVSRNHAEIRWLSNGYLIRDLGAANPTQILNKQTGAFIPLDKPYKLVDGDQIKIIGTVFRYRAPRMPYQEPDKTGQTATAPQKLGTLRFALQDRELTLGPKLMILPFETQVQIGRGETNDLRLMDRSVSRRHASIIYESGRFVLADLGSSGGVKVNGEDISRPVVLNDKSLLQIGQFEFIFEEKPVNQTDNQYVLIRSGQQLTLQVGELIAGTGDIGSDQQNGKQSTTLMHNANVHPLRKIRPFDDMDQALFEKLVPHLKKVKYRQGQEIAREGQPRGAFMAVLEGYISLERTLRDRGGERMVVLAKLGPESTYGERTVFANQHFPHRLVAATDVQVYRLEEADFTRFLSDDRQMLAFFQQQVANNSASVWLRGTILMSKLSRQTIQNMAGRMRYRVFAAGEVLAEKDQPCEELFLIVGGEAQAFTTKTNGQRQVIAELSVGDTFGDGIAAQGEVYSMTVVARTLVDAYVLTRADFDGVLSQSPDPIESLGTELMGLPLVAVLNRINPFNTMPPQLVAQIAETMKIKRFSRGTVITLQGDKADAFYIIRKGQVEVGFATSGGEFRTDMTLGPGQFFGEAALSNNPRHSNKITAIEDCELLTLYRPQFQRVLEIGGDLGLSEYLAKNMSKRYRPKRIPNWTLTEQTNAQGENFHLLSNGDSFFRLTEGGHFLWKLMDGDNSLNDLALAYCIEFKSLDIDGVSRIVAQLQAAGFLEIAAINEDYVRAGEGKQVGGLARFWFALSRILTAQTELKKSDGFFTTLYKYFGRVFFLKPVVWLMGLIIVAGIAAFVVQGGLSAILTPPVGALLKDTWWLLILVLLFNVFIHEIAHGLATKHFGRPVNGVGIGWQWVGPIFFVNTNEIWLEKRGPRIVVNLAGPLVNILFCNICFLLRLGTQDDNLQHTLFNMGVVAFTFAFINLAPIMELDGYYALMDWLEIPGLRKKALVHVRCWLTGRADVRPYTAREKKIFRWFVAAIPVYLIIIAVQFGFWLAGIATGFLEALMDRNLAVPVGWAVAIAITLVMSFPLFAEPFATSNITIEDEEETRQVVGAGSGGGKKS